ncbi:MAG: ATPase [Actinomyces sp.]|uniref:ATPase n=1 Tax=Actinomyces sp. TaxID=29317 RepID=UPI0026DDAE88|nr:ATPase [Actinomyces sp.]MDO4242663.1 ATPase [Actinomyces sp.]
MTTSRDAGEDLLRILDEIDSLVVSARSMPMSASAIVNRDEVLDLVERARRAVPTAVRRAEKIVAEADAVLAQGRAEAERIVERAHEEADRLVAGENVVRLANDRADVIISAAEDKAADLRRGADGYSDRTLAALEAELGRITEQVHAGRQVLADRMGPDRHDTGRDTGRDAGRRSAGWSVDPSASRH